LKVLKMKLSRIIFMSCIQLYTSEHNHTKKYDEQWLRMINLGKKFDKELEKAEKGLPYEFVGIFKAQNRLVGSIVCPRCQAACRSIIQHNMQEVVPKAQQKLAAGELPKHDPERGHYV
jgi:hypothetical protein